MRASSSSRRVSSARVSMDGRLRRGGGGCRTLRATTRSHRVAKTIASTGIAQPDLTGAGLRSNSGTRPCSRSRISCSGTPSETQALMSWRHCAARGLGHESSVFPGQNGLFVVRTIACTCRLSCVSSTGTDAHPTIRATDASVVTNLITSTHKHGIGMSEGDKLSQSGDARRRGSRSYISAHSIKQPGH
jgi:hypothetical protein